MQLPPLKVIATWPEPNYVNPTDVRGPAILILTVIFIPLLVILVALRIYTRLRLSRNFGADDIAIVTAVFPTVGCAILAQVAVLHYGWNRHIWDVPPDQVVLGLKFAMAVEILFVASACLTKVSMLLLILRIMGDSSGVLRWMSITLMGIVCSYLLVYLIVVINTCSPVSEYWTLSLAPQQCINEAAHLLAGGIINTTTDFCVVLIPIPVVLRLNLPLRQKVACTMLFGAGFIVCFAAGIRMSYTYQLNTTYDKTWLAYPVWISGTVELYLGIIAASIPAIKPFIIRYFPKLLSNGNNLTNQPRSFSNNYSKHAKPRLERISSFSGLNDIDFDRMHIAMSTYMVGVSNNSKPLPLSPAVSTSSTYIIAGDNTRPATRWNGPLRMSSLLSPTHIPEMDSREELMRKVTRVEDGGGDLDEA